MTLTRRALFGVAAGAITSPLVPKDRMLTLGDVAEPLPLDLQISITQAPTPDLSYITEHIQRCIAEACGVPERLLKGVAREWSVVPSLAEGYASGLRDEARPDSGDGNTRDQDHSISDPDTSPSLCQIER